jgi:hypothetical protein
MRTKLFWTNPVNFCFYTYVQSLIEICAHTSVRSCTYQKKKIYIYIYIYSNMWQLQLHNSAPASFRRAMWDELNKTCHKRWTGTEDALHGHHVHQIWIFVVSACGNTCSCCWQRRGTSPSHFGHLWDYLQILAIFLRKRRPMLRRVKACVKYHEVHIEHLFQTYSFSYKSQFKCFE